MRTMLCRVNLQDSDKFRTDEDFVIEKFRQWFDFTTPAKEYRGTTLKP